MTKWFRTARKSPCWLWLLISIVAGNAFAENTNLTFAPVPDWVRSTDWTTKTNWAGEAKSDGTRCLLYEEQDYPQKAGEFIRVVELMENESGVQDSGSLRIGFEPEFQKLCLHKVVIHRQGKVIDSLNPSKVRVIQPESELNGDMFTGRQTAVLFIENLRVGDILEYAYTRYGANPILNGHYSSDYTIQAGTPVEHQLFRVIWDSAVPLQQKLHSSDVRAVIKPFGAGKEYSWEFLHLPAIPFEDYKPAGYNAYPFVEVSDFAGWRNVVDWALPLYTCNPTNLPPEMEELLARWQSSSKSDEERARLALQFVQDDMRYTGIELGPDSYRPADPVETFEKRFGDCKGKVVLLRFLLQQMHIQSYPALVNSTMHEGIEDRLPSPFAFDHVILQIILAGKKIWVDPTYSHQGGSLVGHYVPPYGKALIIAPGNGVLESIPRSRPENGWQQKATSTFTIKNYDLPVAFTVRTEYRGASADDMRDEVADTAPADQAKNYLNYYARLYPGITGNGPLKVTDNRLANVVTVEEFYTITNLWKRDDANSPRQACFYADNLNNALTDPDTRIRKTPLALSYPMLREQDVIVHLPGKGWDIPDLDTNMETDSFSFDYRRRLHGDTVTFAYACRTKQATVPTDRVPGYLAERDHMADLLSDTLQDPTNDGPMRFNWLMIVIAIFTSIALAIACVWYWRHTNAKSARIPPPFIEDPQLQGLGGWLILVGFGVCLGPFVRIFTVGQNWEAYFSAEIWQTVAMPRGASYHPLYGPLLMFELLGNNFLFALNLLALCLFFTKRRAFPKIYITLLLAQAVFLVLDDVGSMLIPSIASTASGKNHTQAFRGVGSALIWCLYMMKSRRVKATFIK